ncbi:MAG: hypothetical protein ABJF11_10780 [Reichenbachiella sp.]|uniref:hypothetical protein n=1 Tax=Reichenbachiella sp. TaxID=2184521 RepID=UPI003265CB58
MNYGKHVEKYLKKIDEGIAFDYVGFLNLLNSPKLDLNVSNKDFDARKIGRKNYKVTWIAPWLRSALDKIVSESHTDRNSAANQNQSHSYKVNGSMLLVREGGTHPQVVMFDDNGMAQPERVWPKHALLMENRQNFISADKSLDFLKQFCSTDGIEPKDMLTVFTEGNAISNVLHRDFLAKFDTLFLFLDVDAGGLQIASNLLTLLPNSNVVFLTPNDIKERLERVRTPASAEAIEKVIALGRLYPELSDIAQLIYSTKRELEQESYLNE